MLLEMRSQFINKKWINKKIVVLGLCLCMSSIVLADEGNSVKGTAKESAYSSVLYAKVGTDVITVDEYKQSYQRTIRQKFYHGQPPESELAEVRKAVADELITRQLLLQEANRLGLTADDVAINNTLAQYDQRYANSAQWKKSRDELLKQLQKKLRDEDLLQQLENRVRNIAPPTDAQLEKFYLDNPQKFTEPVQQKISLILLVVDPSSSNDVWSAAMAEGQELVKQLHDGTDFAELARLHSGDSSAERGGDMGYIHREMLSVAAQRVVDQLKPGEISDAVRVLQGVAILRLDEFNAERLRSYDEVVTRLRGLLMREQSESAWVFLKQKLRLDTPITVFNEANIKDNDV